MIQTSVADQIIQVINDLCQKFGIAIDWSKETLLPIAEHLGGRVINWCIAADIFWIVFCAIFVAAGIIGLKKGVKWWPDAYDDGEDIACTILIALSIGAIIFCGIGFFVNIFDLIKCLTFPELKLFEYIQSFMQ